MKSTNGVLHSLSYNTVYMEPKKLELLLQYQLIDDKDPLRLLLDGEGSEDEPSYPALAAGCSITRKLTSKED